MPQPTKSMVHVDKILTNIAVKYIQDETAFIADKIFPNVPVEKQSDKYFKFDRDAFIRAQAERRSGSEESAGGGYTLSTDNYYCDQFSFHKDVPPDIAANTDTPLDAYRDATDYITRAMLIAREAKFVAEYFTTGVWNTAGADITGSTSVSTNQVVQWSDYINSTPFVDIKNQKRAIQKRAMVKPNTLIVGAEVHDILVDHPDIVDKMKYVAIPTPQATAAMLAQMFDVDRYLVGESVAATSVEGQTITTGFQWGKSALLVYAAPRPSLMSISGGYTFSWNAFGNGYGVKVDRFPMREKNNSQRVEGDMAFDHKIVCNEAGQFFTTIVA